MSMNRNGQIVPQPVSKITTASFLKPKEDVLTEEVRDLVTEKVKYHQLYSLQCEKASFYAKKYEQVCKIKKILPQRFENYQQNQDYQEVSLNQALSQLHLKSIQVKAGQETIQRLREQLQRQNKLTQELQKQNISLKKEFYHMRKKISTHEHQIEETINVSTKQLHALSQEMQKLVRENRRLKQSELQKSKQLQKVEQQLSVVKQEESKFQQQISFFQQWMPMKINK